jgi:carbamoyltransferase
MFVLGLSFYYHDSSAALIEDGRIVAAAEEERFSRIKHDAGFPGLAIDFVLKTRGITIHDVDHVVFYEKPLVKFQRLLMTSFSTFPRSWQVFRESMHTWLTKKLWVKSLLKDKLGIPDSKLLFADHHMSHAAASYFTSPFQHAAILTVDGAGEWTTGTLGVGKGNRIKITREMRFPHSVGLLYSAFTAYCGFEVNEGEYKLMGMAPYGEPKYVDRIYKMIKVGDDGSLWHDMRHFSYHWSPTSTLSERFGEVMGAPPRDRKHEDKTLDPFYCDVAASIQQVTEEILLKMCNYLHQQTGLKQLAIAGGVALNCVANHRLLRETPFEEIYVHPAAGDDGGAVGAAMWAYHHLLGNEKTDYVLDHAYLGSEYSDAEVEQFLSKYNIPFDKVDDNDKFYTRVAEEMAAGKVGGWFRNRFEWGPRALGTRSIIADPGNPEMKEIVNAKIKFREAFRPFAPSVAVDHAAEYFDIEDPYRHYPYRFMLYVAPVRDGYKEKLQSITHVDGTARIQAVFNETNPDYYGIIKRFGEGSGYSCILNTSFNLKGEPIVEHPSHAFNTFSRSEMDVLFLNNYIVTKDAKKIISETKFALHDRGASVVGMLS